MQLQQIRYFLEIFRTENVSAAARNLYVPRQSLFQQILNLEAGQNAIKNFPPQKKIAAGNFFVGRIMKIAR